MEALTWNPRRILLTEAEMGHVCWRCGASGPDVRTVGPIAYAKNDCTQKPAGASDGYNFPWQDPAAFYPDVPSDAMEKERLQAYTTRKSTKEFIAFLELDLRALVDPDHPVSCRVQQANPEHHRWQLIVPCTDAANNKAYDARSVLMENLSPEAVAAARTPMRSPAVREALAGWRIPDPDRMRRVSRAFLRATERYTDADWSVFAQAADRAMNESPEAFDLFSGLYWRLRNTSKRLPNRGVLWLVLKLMASVPASFRKVTFQTDQADRATWNPLDELPKGQAAGQTSAEARRNRRSRALRYYPYRLPGRERLESQLRRILHDHVKLRHAEPICWVTLCDQLNELMKR
jgi:hypothetical protein